MINDCRKALLVPNNEVEIESYYLPHRHVIKNNSTTKIRPVFDASAIEKNGLSLNQCLETGPNLIEQIPNILLRFRQYKFGRYIFAKLSYK